MVRLYVMISDGEAAQKFIDGRYSGVSIQGRPRKGVWCSITNKDILAMSPEKRLEHIWKYRPGTVYPIRNNDGKVVEQRLCYWAYDDLEYIECSVVNILADDHAKLTSVEMPSGDSMQFSEFDIQDESVRSVLERNDLKSRPIFISGLTIVDALPEDRRMEESQMELKDLLARKDVQEHIQQIVDQKIAEATQPLQTELNEFKAQRQTFLALNSENEQLKADMETLTKPKPIEATLPDNAGHGDVVPDIARQTGSPTSADRKPSAIEILFPKMASVPARHQRCAEWRDGRQRFIRPLRFPLDAWLPAGHADRATMAWKMFAHDPVIREVNLNNGMLASRRQPQGSPAEGGGNQSRRTRAAHYRLRKRADRRESRDNPVKSFNGFLPACSEVHADAVECELISKGY